MGGDHGPAEIIPALELAYKKRPDMRFLVFGDEKEIAPHLSKQSDSLRSIITVIHTDKMIKSEDKPSIALRASKGSSMRLAIEAVQKGQAMAVVSAGNTGALMAIAKIVLKTVPGLHRPAIASIMPGIRDASIMLDLGANVLVDAENLVQFAVLGAAFARAQKKIDTPTVGLLNVGSEENKGPEHVKDAARILSEIEFKGKYHGFVEGDDIMKGTVDVVVSDGYAGNIALKTAEGVGKLTRHYFRSSFLSSPLAILGSVLAFFAIRKFKQQMDPRLYNGGVFLGLNGVCVKSHGGADALGFSSAVLLARRLARQGYIEKIVQDIGDLMGQESFLSRDII
ncbi:MAG: phosphate acyltransferase PlsX [Alphaproteobacteria bacterium]|nr:phosphate acyltransferase PlsX [Alphaproteobacteria bacterium]